MNRFLSGVVRAAIEAFSPPEPVLEVGSFLVEGQEDYADFRPFFSGEYLGIDARNGPGVDAIANVEDLPYGDEAFGTVLALNTFEHVRYFWRGFQEVRRVLRPDGMLVVTVPFYFHIHGYPNDYWRFTPAALEVLLEGMPTVILGKQGLKSRPSAVWAVAFGPERPPPTAMALAHYKTLIGRYAREPLPWRRRLRYQLGRLLFGHGPFAPYLDRERWEVECRTLLNPVNSNPMGHHATQALTESRK